MKEGDHINLSKLILQDGDPSQHYLLRVVGDALSAEGIHEGDFVIVQRRTVPLPGEMVVVVVDDSATIKRYYPEEDTRRVRLEPANREAGTVQLHVGEIEVHGIVVGLMRKF